MNKELTVVRQLLTRMNKSITYCHWKSNQHFSDALIGVDDLDILIDRNQFDELLVILSDLNFKHFYTPSVRTYIGVEDYLGFDPETGMIIHLHLHHQLIVGEGHFKGWHLPIEKEMLEVRRWDEESQVFMSSYFHELLLLILRSGMKSRKRDIFKKQLINGGTLKEYNWLKEKCPDFLEKLNNTAWLDDSIKQGITNIYLNTSSPLRCIKLKYDLFGHYSFYAQGSLLYNTFVREKRECGRALLEIKRRYLKTKYSFVRRRPATGGVTIAFVGMDGAGKSSTIEEIYKWLFKVMDVRRIYLGSGDGPVSIMRAPLKFVIDMAQKKDLVKRTRIEDADKQSANPSLAKKLWIYTLSKERLSRLKQMNRCKLRGYVVLTDRYPQSEIPGLCDGIRLGDSSFAAEVERKAMRRAKLCSPDLVIKMMVSPEVAMQRKPGELSFATGKHLSDKISRLLYSERTKIVTINSNQPQEKVWLDVKNAIWDVL